MAEPRERSRPGAVPGQRPGNRGSAGSSSPGQGAALECSVSALSGALHRLATTADLAAAAAAATEAVWWVTTVDAALTRRHPAACAQALAALDPAARKAVERSFAGFRFIRGQRARELASR